MTNRSEALVSQEKRFKIGSYFGPRKAKVASTAPLLMPVTMSKVGLVPDSDQPTRSPAVNAPNLPPPDRTRALTERNRGAGLFRSGRLHSWVVCRLQRPRPGVSSMSRIAARRSRSVDPRSLKALLSGAGGASLAAGATKEQRSPNFRADARQPDQGSQNCRNGDLLRAISRAPAGP